MASAQTIHTHALYPMHTRAHHEPGTQRISRRRLASVLRGGRLCRRRSCGLLVLRVDIRAKFVAGDTAMGGVFNREDIFSWNTSCFEVIQPAPYQLLANSDLFCERPLAASNINGFLQCRN